MEKKCTTCERLGRDCPKKLLLLPLEEMIDWLHYLMAQHKITHETMARISGVPKGTIDRVMAKQSADCRYSTMHAMVCGLFAHLGMSTACADDSNAANSAHTEELERRVEELQHALDDSERERQALQARVADFDEQRAFMRDQIAKKDARIDALSNIIRSNRAVIKVLSVLLCIAVLVIIGALVVDRLNPDLGYIWRSAASSISQ